MNRARVPEMQEEGVIRFKAKHRWAALDRDVHGALADLLIAWRDRLLWVGLVGRDRNRYCGVGFGNVSGRLPPFPGPPGARPFLITGTQTGGRPTLTLADLCVVTRYRPECNRVESFGLVRPSSESMTHAVLYDAGPTIRFVFHGHSPAIWVQASALGLPVTDPTADYGTPAMCQEVQRLLRDPEVARRQVLIMGGHQDGVLAFAESADEAGRALLDLHSEALSLASLARQDHPLQSYTGGT
jgi:ribulose-5-phosphate 4-epimerase/fuculose-1-phosphate aldolase